MKLFLSTVILALGVGVLAQGPIQSGVSGPIVSGGGSTFTGGTLTSQLTWGAGIGAITQVLGPSDQDLKITAGNATRWQLRLGSNNAAEIGDFTNNNAWQANTASLSGIISTNTIIGVVAGGITLSSTNQPTIGTCGTGTVTTGSTNNAGEVTATGATSCNVAFATTPFTQKPYCTATEETRVAALFISTASTTSFTVGNLTAGDTFMYTCNGK